MKSINRLLKLLSASFLLLSVSSVVLEGAAPLDPRTFARDIYIGSADDTHSLIVFGDTRIGGDVTAGEISQTTTIAGNKHIIGIQTLNPRTQQLKIVFKDRTQDSLGAWIDFDFVTTATSYRLGLPDQGKANVIVHGQSIYCHPWMSASQIMSVDGMGQRDMKATSTSRVINGPRRTSVNDFYLTPTVRIEPVTHDLAFGFVPWQSDVYPTTGTFGDRENGGFYEENWNATDTPRPVWETGVVSYTVRSGNLSSVSVVDEVETKLLPLDLFDVFTDEELAALLTALNEYFGNDSTRVYEYLAQHKDRLKAKGGLKSLFTLA